MPAQEVPVRFFSKRNLLICIWKLQITEVWSMIKGAEYILQIMFVPC